MRKDTPLPVAYEEPCEPGQTGEGFGVAEEVDEEYREDAAVVVVSGLADVEAVGTAEEADLSVVVGCEVVMEVASVELDFVVAAALGAGAAAGAARIVALQTF